MNKEERSRENTKNDQGSNNKLKGSEKKKGIPRERAKSVRVVTWIRLGGGKKPTGRGRGYESKEEREDTKEIPEGNLLTEGGLNLWGGKIPDGTREGGEVRGKKSDEPGLWEKPFRRGEP